MDVEIQQKYQKKIKFNKNLIQIEIIWRK